MTRKSILLLSAFLLGACSTGNDESSLVSVSLADTRLAGDYTLVDYLFEYNDGRRYDPSIVKLTGTLIVTADSAYLEGIRAGNDSTLTKGIITQVMVSQGNQDIGELQLTLEAGDSLAAGKSSFTFHRDTLVLVTEVSKERDVAFKTGFRETAYYARDPVINAR